jgi:lysophospholipase L1-like esterase
MASGRTVVTLPEGLRPTVLGVRGEGGSVRPASRQARWLCYGDSIAEGWAASGPGRSWPAIVGRRLGLDVVNLGYAGAARGEIAVAEAMAGIEADLVTLAYGTNCWQRIPHSAAQVAADLDAFCDVVLAGHPDVPLVVLSPIVRPDAEATANALGATLADLRDAMEETVRRRAATDDRLSLVEGRDLVDPGLLVDGVHPGDDGHLVLAQAMDAALTHAAKAAPPGQTGARTEHEEAP